MFGLMLRIQLTFNRWFENVLLEDRYRLLARRGGFEQHFDERLAHYRERKQYGAVRLAFSDARYEHARGGLGKMAGGSTTPPGQGRQNR